MAVVMVQVLTFFLLVLCAGCAAHGPTALFSGYSAENTAVCFTKPAEIPSIVERFYASRDLTTESGKIDYLIERVRSANVTFVRNSEKFKGDHAADFLRWKLNRLRTRYGVKVETAQDFVSKIASGSRKSGKPYVVVLSDRSRYSLGQILQNELNQLELCLQLLTQAGGKALPQGTVISPGARKP